MAPSARLRPSVAIALAAGLAACAAPAPSVPRPASMPAASRSAPLDLPAAAISGRLAFSADTSDGATDVFLLDLSDPDGPRTRLTDGPARDLDPELSPDGTRVAYRVNPEAGSDAADIWLMAADGSGAVDLTGDPSLDNWSPAWSPDGRRIAFASTRDGGVLRVWTMAPDASDLRRVTTGHGEYPDWSPDGARIVYAAPASGSTGRYELWTIDAAGNESPTRLTTSPSTDFAPAWSPDGSWIAYQYDTGAAWEVWIVRPDGSDAQRLSPDGEDGVWPTWSPGGLLAWSGTQGLTFVDLSSGATRSVMPAEPGTDFLSWGP